MMTTSEIQQSNSHSPTTNSSPSVDHSRRKHPCVLCQQRKVKCDRNDPCANCTKACVPCISSSVLPPKRRKKRFPEAELLARLRRYEDHLRSYGADIDAINNETVSLPAGLSSNIQLKSEHNLKAKMSHSQLEPPNHAIRSLAIRRSLKHVKNNFHQGMPEEFRDTEELLQASSDEETLEVPIMKAYDEINPDGSDFFFSTPSSDSIIDLHPSAVHIFRLWQAFIDNVNPLTKIFHAPTVQQQVLEASADLENVPKEMEALMFGIYATAVTSLSGPDCMSMFGEERKTLLARYQNGARQALSRAGLLRSSDMTILQAFVLYLISCLNFSIDPRAHFCLTGVAVRIAQRMGLNYDGTVYALPPFETEMRRRLWFQIMFLDNRVSELSGAGCSVLHYIWTTKLPLNVNDSDLFPDMKEPPMVSKGLTEMAYVLQRCEVVNVLRDMREGGVGETMEEKDQAISQLQKRLSEGYERFCDPSVPLHLLSSLMMRSTIAKLSIGPRQPHTFANISVLPSSEKDKLFQLSLQMIEAHNAMLGAHSLKRFMWHVLTNFPFPAHVYLLVALRHVTTTGPLADRAWSAFEDYYQKRMMVAHLSQTEKPKNSSLHSAVANLTFKAWAARERDVPGIEVPRFVMHLKCRLGGGGMICPKNSKACFEATDVPSHPSAEDMLAVKMNPAQAPEPRIASSDEAEGTTGLPPASLMVPFLWSNDQPPMQFDMTTLGMGFDSELMQGLTPTFGSGVSNNSFGFDPWSDYQPDNYSMGETMNINLDAGFDGGMNGNNFTGNFQ